MMICAPWDSEMFGCLADGRDHSGCCARVGLPPLCQELCTGNVTDINFKYFHCLTFMPQLSSCLLEGYDVLPSSPVNFRFSNLQTNFGILHWDPPETLGETVEDYLVTYEQLTPVHGKSQSVGHANSPYILENLGETRHQVSACVPLLRSRETNVEIPSLTTSIFIHLNRNSFDTEYPFLIDFLLKVYTI